MSLSGSIPFFVALLAAIYPFYFLYYSFLEPYQHKIRAYDIISIEMQFPRRFVICIAWIDLVCEMKDNITYL